MSVAVCKLKTQEERDMDDEGQLEFIRELNSKRIKEDEIFWQHREVRSKS